MSTKGGGYEIEVCRDLSRWWACDPNIDDWFWRASQSGGRATTRAKKGKTTTGHCGDVAASCWQAELLTKFITFEMKRGYNRGAVMVDLLDRNKWPDTPKQRKDTILGFIEQAHAAGARAGTPHWALIHRRDGREPLIYLPRELNRVCNYTPNLNHPSATLAFVSRGVSYILVVQRFHNWLASTSAAGLRRHIRSRSS